MNDVKIAIVGSRRRKDEDNVREIVRKLYRRYKDRLVIVSGGCLGVDSWAEDEARKLGIPDNRIRIFQPDLRFVKTYHEAVKAYYERNKLIAEFATGGIVAFVAEDRKGGTENTIKHARKLKRSISIQRVKLKAVDNPEWSKSLRETTKTYIEKHPEYKPLMDKLLSIAGDFVVIWMYEPDLEIILKRGHLFEGQGSILKGMDFCHCHENVGKLWFEEKMRIVTGWALSKDGLWRQHSWALKDGMVIETTTIREKYFGVILTEEESERFYAGNSG